MIEMIICQIERDEVDFVTPCDYTCYHGVTTIGTCASGRVQHSHWSRALQILCSHWLKVYAITTHLQENKIPPTWGILCLSVCCHGMISGFNAQKDAIKTFNQFMAVLSCVFMA